MSKLSNNIKRFLYRHLSLAGYLRVVSRMFFVGYGLGVGKRSAAYEYPRFLRHLVRRGDTVIDIGANLGYYSRILGKLVGKEGKVYAIEPVEPIREVLKRNVRKLGNVEILPYALGRENGSITMANSSVHSSGYLGTGRNYVRESEEQESEVVEFTAEMRRGSELFAGLERLDFIKCDIEGYETVVMTEMAPLVERFMPVVLIETGGVGRLEILKLFRELGYAGYVLERGRLISVMRAPEKDIVFIPGHRFAEFKELIIK
jgi:FkbM family methyltransferase